MPAVSLDFWIFYDILLFDSGDSRKKRESEDGMPELQKSIVLGKRQKSSKMVVFLEIKVTQ